MESLKSPPFEGPAARVTIENYLSNKWAGIRRRSDPYADTNTASESPLIVIIWRRGRKSTEIPTLAMEPEHEFDVLDQTWILPIQLGNDQYIGALSSAVVTKSIPRKSQ